MRAVLILLGLALGSTLSAEVAGVAALPAPLPDPGAAAQAFGAHVQRTMALLAGSTASHRNHVRILVYGQSISEGPWWREVERDLRARFPLADLEMENRALGGHASNVLVREAETDVYPFYPDLVLFHVYGAHTCYEQLVARMRSRMASEVLITSDHLGADERPNAQGVIEDRGWTRFMARFIPQVAERYGCELVALREPWKRFVLDNHLAAQDLLADGIHPNALGNALYAALVERQLVVRPELANPADRDAVRTVEIGTGATWSGGRLTLAFTGNRIDALASAQTGPTASVLIDGRKPSEFKECYAFTRAQGGGIKIMAIASERAPLVEDWTIRVTAVDRAQRTFTFTAIGSKTGNDGDGSSAKRFVSKSGRLVIETRVEKPAMGAESDIVCDINQVAAGAEIPFRCYALHADRFVAPTIADPALEHAVTLAQNLPNGKHTLTLIADGAGVPPLRALRVYQPSVAAPTAMVYDSVHPEASER